MVLPTVEKIIFSSSIIVKITMNLRYCIYRQTLIYIVVVFSMIGLIIRKSQFRSNQLVQINSKSIYIPTVRTEIDNNVSISYWSNVSQSNATTVEFPTPTYYAPSYIENRGYAHWK